LSKSNQLVVGQAIRHRRTSSATGGQVTPEAHEIPPEADKLRPDSVLTNKFQQRQQAKTAEKGAN